MNIHDFMTAYKRVWLDQDSAGFADLFTRDGTYHNTPFQVQTGRDALITYWDRIQLQNDIRMKVAVLAETENGGIGHWWVDYQVASEELFDIWAKSTGTGMPDREPGDPLPRLTLDGTLIAEFGPDGRARDVRIFWHSQAYMP
ncbi:nuclear transport factor 2 family protein [Shimia sp.]|uniref:nuclear transport factor 2 family protein n=1 Tax=Shimia sp. TaxID=1954381 RepID=UPI0032992F33